MNPNEVPVSIRFPRDLHAKIKDTQWADRRSFNKQVLILCEEALRMREADLLAIVEESLAFRASAEKLIEPPR